MSTQTPHRSVLTPSGIAAKLLTTLRGLFDGLVARDDDQLTTAGLGPDDPWDAGYRAGRRAGYRQAARADGDPITHRAPHREGSAAAAQWWQGFKLGFYDGAAERS